MRFLLILEQKVKTPRNVNTVFMVAVICPVCPFIAQKGSLRKRNKFDVLTERMISLCRCLWKIRVFLCFVVDDPFNSEMNAMPAVISRCPFHIRHGWGLVTPRHPRPWNVPTVSQIPLLFICVSCWWPSFHRGKKKQCSCSCFVHGKYFVLDLWPTAKPTVFPICTSPIIQLSCSPKLCRTFVLFLLAITVVPREIKVNAYAHFGGANKVYYGWCQNGESLKVKDYFIEADR